MTLTKFLRTGAAALGALAVASVAPASAADIYAPSTKDVPVYVPLPLWTGFYIGGHLGVDWAQFNANDFWWWDNAWNNGVELGRPHMTSTGAFGGGQFGYNWQTSNWVFGIEVDLGAASEQMRGNLLGETTWGNPQRLGHLISLQASNDGGFYGDVTGRLGYTWGSALLYVKGGFAWLESNLKFHETVMDRWGNTWGFDGPNNNGNFLTGGTIGGGLEWRVSPNWSFKVEYLYFDFSLNRDFCCDNWGNDFRFNHDLQVNTVKLGVNYFFYTAPTPLK